MAVSSCIRFSFVIQVARSRELLERESKLDPLTGLGNVRAFGANAKDVHDGSIALAVLGIDNFKACNDVFGHMKGDELLVSLASILRAQFTGSAKLYRPGGDEFIVASETLDEEQMDRKLKEARSAFEEAVRAAGIKLEQAEVSFTWGSAFGEATCPADILELRLKADRMMLREKRRKWMPGDVRCF